MTEAVNPATAGPTTEGAAHGASGRGRAHQFDDAEQQRQAAALGMWAFLCTEVLFFGALFCAFAVCRWRYPIAFRDGARLLKFWRGSVNTAVLLCSSFAMALAVHAAATGHRKNLVRFLLATMALGLTFLGIKAAEYRAEWEDHLVPHFNFDHSKFSTLRIEPIAQPDAPPGAIPVVPGAMHVELFFTFYFIMTGLHALHMVVGISLLAWLVVRARRGDFGADYYNPVEITGLYWHFVDIVWVFLFPLLYLLIQQ